MEQKKKVILISAYSGLVNRGVETVVDELTRRFCNDLFVWKLIGGQATDAYTIHIPLKFAQSGNMLSERLFLSRKKIYEFVFYIRSLVTINKIRPDVVFVFNSGWHLLIYKVLSKFLNFKLVLSGQSGPGWDDRFNLLFKPDIFVCLTNAQKEWVKGVSPKQKIVVIANGVDTKTYHPRKTREHKRPVVLTVAASEKAKNVDLVINAIDKEKYDYLYVGSGSLERKLDNLGKKTLGKYYRRISLTHDKLPDVYRNADVFVFLQSYSEAFGIVFIEALASGLPIICFDDPIRRELLGDNAIYIKDSKGLNTAIDNALSKLPTNSAAKRYDWDRIAKQYIEMIIDL